MSDEIPKLQKILNEPEPLWVKEKQPSILATDGKHHLLPGSDLSMWAHGVIQVTLDTLPQAHHDYAGIVEGWSYDDFTPLYDSVMQSHLIQYQERPFWKIKENFTTDDPVIEAQQTRIRNFIKVYFNNQRNIDNHRIRVSADTSPYLVNALCFRSQSDCFHINLAEWERQTLVPVPTSMTADTDYHRLVTSTMTEIQAHLRENQTILRWSAIWRLCRVSPGRINFAATDLGKGLHPDLWDGNKIPDEDYIKANIRKPDKATSYL